MKNKQVKSAQTDLEQAHASITAAKFSLTTAKHPAAKDAAKLGSKTNILIHKLKKDT